MVVDDQANFQKFYAEDQTNFLSSVNFSSDSSKLLGLIADVVSVHRYAARITRIPVAEIRRIMQT